MSGKLLDLKKKLTEIFQLDQTDLDFGIYRIMNEKAEEITEFLDRKLLPQVKECFADFENEGQAKVKAELDKLIETLTQAGMNPDDSPKVQELKSQLASAVDVNALENEVFSHLTSFFSRYYQGGDFLSLRRYKKDVYAIPYEGEEVKLHWANSDQYYIKTSENFKDYSFKIADDKTVHFKLIDAETEKDNNKTAKDKERRFMLCNEEPLLVEDGELFIRFNYIADDSKINQARHNEKAIELVKTEIEKPEYAEFKKLFEKYQNPNRKDDNRLVIEKHLTDYTAKNSFDYFIHKDLGGFLRRELDFYIKNEVLFLDDLDDKNIKQALNKSKAIKKIANKVIDLLEQLENFQKKLWLKKKFVVESGYCITLDKVSEDLYPEIVSNKEQIEEWKKLFAIDEINPSTISVGYSDPLTLDFLKQNPFLVLDTKFFTPEFKEKLLENVTSIDEQTDGLLINADNFHALNLLQEKYKESVKGIYIDPPYNTNASKIAYKNGYEHSSWLSLMENRITASKSLLSSNGIISLAIDDYEHRRLNLVLDQIFGTENFISNIAILTNPKGRDQEYIAQAHDYSILYANNKTFAETYNFKLSKEELGKKYAKSNESESFRELPLKRTGSEKLREDRPYMFFPFFYNSKEDLAILPTQEEYSQIYKKELNQFDDVFLEKLIAKYNELNYHAILPVDDKGNYLRWRWGYDSSLKGLESGDVFVRSTNKNSYNVYQKDLADTAVKPKSLWLGEKYDASSKGTNLLASIIPNNPFDYPKSVFTVEDNITIMSNNKSLLLDYFAGSGTTGHAVINLNREDNKLKEGSGKRKFILVEMGEYFETVTKPRVQKVVYSEDWKNGKPVSRKGSSHIFKYVRLESYEDALNNLKQKDSAQTQIAFDAANENVNEKYMLSYMMDFEYGDSLLNIDIFKNPFDYKMKITNETETKTVNVDLVETFNYLIGLNVRSMYDSNGFKIIEGYNRSEENVLVIWRNTEEKSNDDLDEMLKKLRVNPRDYEFDKIYVNGDNNLDNLKLDEENWKVNLIEYEFKKRMFDVQDV